MTKKTNRLKRRNPAADSGSRLKAHGSSEINWDLERPIFALHAMPDSHCVDTCEANEQASFATALWKRSRLSWRDLRQAPRHGLGYEKIAKVNVAIPDSVPADASMIAFRFDGMKAMVGYRDRNIFHVLWLDRDFTVYDH